MNMYTYKLYEIQGAHSAPDFVSLTLLCLTYAAYCGKIIISLFKGEHHENKRYYPRFYRYTHTKR